MKFILERNVIPTEPFDCRSRQAKSDEESHDLEFVMRFLSRSLGVEMTQVLKVYRN